MASTREPDFSSEELRTFLAAVDRHLRGRATIKILGGSGLLLAYNLDRTTRDIDVFETELAKLLPAIEKAVAETGLDIPISPAGGAVGDWPYNSHDRLIRLMPELKRLKVLTLEAHDLALSKAVRAWEKDLAMIRDLHQIHPLDLQTLLQRYIVEMSHAIGHPKTLDLNFCALIERLFGSSAAAEVALRLLPKRRLR
jgi:hypothetical protein